MKKTGTLLVFLFASISLVRANISLIATYKDTPESTEHILSVAGPLLGSTDLISLLRLEDLSKPPSGSPFTVDYLSDSTANVSWNLGGTGFELAGIYIFGGSNGANLYHVTNDQMISGSGTIHTPLTGNSGEFAGISHILFLGTAVPEPASITLLFTGAVSLLVWRLRRR